MRTMAGASRAWVSAGLPPGTYDSLTGRRSASRLWSLLLDVAQARATQRLPTALLEQWNRDPYVRPGIGDQRRALEVDSHLLDVASMCPRATNPERTRVQFELPYLLSGIRGARTPESRLC